MNINDNFRLSLKVTSLKIFPREKHNILVKNHNLTVLSSFNEAKVAG